MSWRLYGNAVADISTYIIQYGDYVIGIREQGIVCAKIPCWEGKSARVLNVYEIGRISITESDGVGATCIRSCNRNEDWGLFTDTQHKGGRSFMS